MRQACCALAAPGVPIAAAIAAEKGTGLTSLLEYERFGGLPVTGKPQ
jgi:hypothetical protein